MNLKLVKLTYEYKNQLEDMLSEWIDYNNQNKDANHSPYAIFKNDYKDFDYYLENLDVKVENDQHVPTSTYFCLDEDRNIFVGAVNIRHKLNHGLIEDGGHIGDGVRPSERRKGIATKMISLALEKCKDLGLNRVMITCDKENIASKKSITNNGGIYESTFGSDDRYWIELNENNKIIGDKIILRKAKLDDITSIWQNVWNDEKVYQTMLFTPTLSLSDALNRMIRTTNYQALNYAYFVCDKITDEAIGMCAIQETTEGTFEECGLCVGGAYQSQGYGKEMLSLLLDLSFNKLNAKEFKYSCFEDNNKSKSLLKYYNFKFTDKYNIIRNWDKKEFIVENYILLKEDYIK